MKSLVWNGLISFYSSTYLITTMIAFLNMYDLRLTAKEYSGIEVLSSLLSVIIIVGSVMIPSVVMISLYLKIQAIASLKLTDSDRFEVEINKIYDSMGEIIKGFNLHIVDYKMVILLKSFNFFHQFVLVCTLMLVK
jgi:hypothetical protein